MKKNISLEFGGFALIEYLLSKGSFPKNFKVLDIGGALGNHCKVMRYFGLCVDTIDKYEKKAEFIGDFNTHYGIFAGCGTGIPFEDGGSCC